MTQGRKLIKMLKKRWITTLDMQMQGVSTCPWKRITEQLLLSEQLIKTKRYPKEGRWFYAYRVVNLKICE